MHVVHSADDLEFRSSIGSVWCTAKKCNIVGTIHNNIYYQSFCSILINVYEYYVVHSTVCTVHSVFIHCTSCLFLDMMGANSNILFMTLNPCLMSFPCLCTHFNLVITNHGEALPCLDHGGPCARQVILNQVAEPHRTSRVSEAARNRIESIDWTSTSCTS
jgi:hypothetical protein